MGDIERELEAELHRVLDPVASLPIPPRKAVPARGPIKTLLGGAGAALAIKVLTGVAVAAAALTVAGAATTGSLNPTVWGQQVKQQVEACKDQLAQGDHGIGDCVSQFANQHGQAVASDARHHGNGDGSSNGKDNNGNGNGGNQGTGNGNGHKDNPNGTTPPTPPANRTQGKVSPKP